MTAPALSLKRLAAWSSPGMATSALLLPLTVYIPQHYIQHVGLSPKEVALALLIGRVWDMVTDPLVGYLIDHSRIRFGARKLWVALSLPGLMASGYFLFFPPEGAGLWYLTGWLLVNYTALTCFQVPHISWGVWLSEAYDQRSRLYSVREVMSVSGMIIVLALPALMVHLQFDEAAQIGSMGLYIMVLAPPTILACILSTPDTNVTSESTFTFSDLKVAFRSKAVLQILAIEFLLFSGLSVSGTLYIPTMVNYVNAPNLAHLTLLLFFSFGVAAIPVWMYVSKRTSKHTAMGVTSLWGAFTMLTAGFVIGPASLAPMMIMVFIFGFVYAAPQVLLRAMAADAIDDAAALSTRKLAATVTAASVIAAKLGTTVMVSVTLWVLEDSFGYQRGHELSADVSQSLFLAWVSVPGVMFALCAAVAFTYSITRERHASNLDTYRSRPQLKVPSDTD